MQTQDTSGATSQHNERTPERPQARMSFVARFGVILFWLLVWQVASLLLAQPLLLPGPVDVAGALSRIVMSPAFGVGVAFSFERIATGFLLSFFFGVGLAALAHRWPVLRVLFSPVVHAAKSIPIVCVVVLLLLWVGSGEVSRVAVFLATFPAVFLSVLEALDAANPELSKLLRTMDVPRWRCALADTWQQLLPYVVGTCKNACGMAWKAGVAAEVIGTPAGSLGAQVYQARLLLETPDLFAWTLVIVLVAWATELLFMACVRLSGPTSLRIALIGLRGASVADKGMSEEVHGRLVLHGLLVGYSSALVAPVDMELGPGERTVMRNASGTGKTTLIKTLLGWVQPLGGALEVPRPCGVVLQESLLVEAYSAVENVALVTGLALGEAEIRAALVQVGLAGESLEVPVRELSGGQRRRVELVRALGRPVALLLLDEPFASLDERSRRLCAELLHKMRPQACVLMASHDELDAKLVGAATLQLEPVE